MNFQTPQFFFLTLGLVTLLGASIGYCIAAIRERRIARGKIEKLKSIMVQEQRAAVSDLMDARKSIKRLHDMSRKPNVSTSQQKVVGNKAPTSSGTNAEAFAMDDAADAGVKQVPTLSRRVTSDSRVSNAKHAGDSPVHSAVGGESVASQNVLKMSLPGELEIPKLSESELPESLSDLEPELSSIDGKRDR